MPALPCTGRMSQVNASKFYGLNLLICQCPASVGQMELCEYIAPTSGHMVYTAILQQLELVPPAKKGPVSL